MLQKYRTHYAHIDGGRLVTAMLPSGRFVAYQHDQEEPRGYGTTRTSATLDLIDKILRLDAKASTSSPT